MSPMTNKINVRFDMIPTLNGELCAVQSYMAYYQNAALTSMLFWVLASSWGTIHPRCVVGRMGWGIKKALPTAGL